MASYENVTFTSKNGQNVIQHKANTSQKSISVSNDIYGAIILEPTIPSSLPTCDVFDDLDDFWLDVAKGQTLKHIPEHTNINCPSRDKRSNRDILSPISKTQANISDKSRDDFAEDTQSEFPRFALEKSHGTNVPTTFGGQHIHSTASINTLSHINELETDSNASVYEEIWDAGSHKKSTDVVTAMIAPLPRTSIKCRTMSDDVAYDYAEFRSTDDNMFTTKSLDENFKLNLLPPLHASTLYDSVDNLATRKEMPLPDQSPLQWMEITDDHVFPVKRSKNDEPVYAQVIKKSQSEEKIDNFKNKSSKDVSPEVKSASLCNDEFYSLASERISNLSIKTYSSEGNSLNKEYSYAKVNKPKRYVNWPVTNSMRRTFETPSKHLSDNSLHVQTETDKRQSDPNEHYSTITEIENKPVTTSNERVTEKDGIITSLHIATPEFVANNTNKFSEKPGLTSPLKPEKEKSPLKSKVKGLLTNVKNKNQSQRPITSEKPFYPFSFIFNFEIKPNGKDSFTVKKILPNIEGKCWLICQQDFKIRLYDGQGQETESVHIGFEGEDMTCDNIGHLYISCSDTKTIYMVDTKNLCRISSFVESPFIPSGLVFDSLDNTLVVCQNRTTFSIAVGVAPNECVQKYSIIKPSKKWNFTTEKMFTKPTHILKNENSDIIVSDIETSSITIFDNHGQLKSRFTGNDVFKLHSSHVFAGDLQSNIILLSQIKKSKSQAQKSCDNVCLLDANGNFMATFSIDEVKRSTVNAMAFSDFGFLWIAGDHGVFIFDYQML